MPSVPPSQPLLENTLLVDMLISEMYWPRDLQLYRVSNNERGFEYKMMSEYTRIKIKGPAKGKTYLKF